MVRCLPNRVAGVIHEVSAKDFQRAVASLGVGVFRHLGEVFILFTMRPCVLIGSRTSQRRMPMSCMMLSQYDFVARSLITVCREFPKKSTLFLKHF